LGAKEPNLPKQFDGGAPVALPNDLDLSYSWGRMNLNANAKRLGSLFGLSEKLWRTVIDGVGVQHASNTAVKSAIIAFNESNGLLESLNVLTLGAVIAPSALFVHISAVRAVPWRKIRAPSESTNRLCENFHVARWVAQPP